MMSSDHLGEAAYFHEVTDCHVLSNKNQTVQCQPSVNLSLASCVELFLIKCMTASRSYSKTLHSHYCACILWISLLIVLYLVSSSPRESVGPVT